MSMTAPRTTPGGAPPAFTALQIVVRPGDSLLWSLPLWLLCRQRGLPVQLLDTPQPADAAARKVQDPGWAHLPAEVRLGGTAISHLSSILEALHEAWPQAQVWPANLVLRTRAREAMLGLVRRCAPLARPVLRPPGPPPCDQALRETLHQALHQALETTPQGCVAALATVPLLLGLHPLFSPSHRQALQAMLQGPAGLEWQQLPAIRARSSWHDALARAHQA